MFSMIRQLVRISLPVFLVRLCSKDFRKVAQNSFNNSKEVKYKDNYLLRRHTAPGEYISRGLNGKEHSNIFTGTSGFCDKFEKNVIIKAQKTKFLGFIVNSVQLTLSIYSQKLSKIRHRCWERYKVSMVSILELLIGLL